MAEILLKYCTLRPESWGLSVIFRDGSECSNWPLESPEYSAVAADCGHTDLMAYCREHDLLHALIAETFFDRPSYVLWQAAHRLPNDPAASAWEERLVHYFHRDIRSWPLDAQWADAQARARALFPALK